MGTKFVTSSSKVKPFPFFNAGTLSPDEDKSRMVGKRQASYQQAMNEQAVPRIGHRQSSYQKAIGSPNEEVPPKIGHRQSSYQRAIGEY